MRKYRIPAGLVIMALAVGGCTSTDGFLGLASKGYVDRQLAETDQRTRQELDRTEGTVAALTERVDGYGDVRKQVEFLLSELQRTQETTRELRELARMVERRLDTIPAETLRQLVIIIQDHLDRNEPYNAPPEGAPTAGVRTNPRAASP